MKSRRAGALKLCELGFSCKINKCSDIGIGGFGELPTHTLSLIQIENYSDPSAEIQLECAASSLRISMLPFATCGRRELLPYKVTEPSATVEGTMGEI